jgi:hypothetical protein
MCIHRYLFDLGSHVSFRVNEQQVAIVVLENLRGRFRANIHSFSSRPQKTRQESLWPRVTYERYTPQNVLRLQTCLAMIRNGRHVRCRGGKALCQQEQCELVVLHLPKGSSEVSVNKVGKHCEFK